MHAETAESSNVQSAAQRIAAAVRGGPGRSLVDGLRDGARAYFLFRCHQQLERPMLVVAASSRGAERLVSDLRFFFAEEDCPSPLQRRVHLLPSWEVAPFEDVSPTGEILAARIEALYQLSQGRNPIVVATPEALLLRVPPRGDVGRRYAYLVEGEDVDRDSFAAQLQSWGYHRTPLVEDRGEFSVRGDIIDVFPPGHGEPVRLQLFGDTIEALHSFDVVSQRLRQQHEELVVLPVREFDPGRGSDPDLVRAIEARLLELDVDRRDRGAILDGLSSGTLFPGVEFLLPYFHDSLESVFAHLPADTSVWIDSPGEVDVAVENAWQQIEQHAALRASEHRFYVEPERLFVGLAEYRQALGGRAIVEMESLNILHADDSRGRANLRSFSTADLRAQRVQQRRELGFAPVAEQVREWRESGTEVFFVAGTEAQQQRLARLLEAHEISAQVVDASFAAALSRSSGGVRVLRGHLSEGFRMPDERLALVTESDVFGETRRRAARRVSVSQLLKNLNQLRPNDFVVHLDHGVGVYRGLRHLKVADTEGDYLHLEYAGGDRLYLPVDRINLVQKYVGGDGAAPALDKLGGASWENTKAKTRESILAMAKELLSIYAAREIDDRLPYAQEDDSYREFEAKFPFEETPDQRQAIDDVLRDLQQAKPMDRLVCGDVGYGKTEVAMRAAFLAAMGGGQVAVLVPTTVLAFQHHTNFNKRFEGYPLRIEMLSRFRSAAESKEVLRGLADGSVDIVVGTHRLLQSDIEFKRLSLLIIDEEHRFGVRHKEKIKAMRSMVDVMALTATPIPRTLQMSLMGIRDLSVIETPPIDRQAIRTYVTRYDDDIIHEAVQRELARKGQVFFVHNRVENIEVMAQHLRRLLPEARFAVAHGQMAEGALEKVMLAFMRREVDVLVCSAIIESGLDIPNANTIIINRADHLGLAQLYQLRGRVGRSHERAYAYLMIPGEHIISREAQKRLKVLQELDDLGGGFKLAAHDLEIRGAGNLLGKQQSGQITAVGFELYTQMMEDAVHELRGQRRRTEIEPEIQLGFPAYVPDSYIADENQRLAFYRRLAEIKTSEEIEEIAAELRERFGPIPPLVDSFLRVMDLRRTLKAHLVARIVRRGAMITLQFHPEATVDVDRLIALVERNRKNYRLSADFQLTFRPRSEDWDGIVADIQSVLRELGDAADAASHGATEKEARHG